MCQVFSEPFLPNWSYATWQTSAYFTAFLSGLILHYIASIGFFCNQSISEAFILCLSFYFVSIYFVSNHFLYIWLFFSPSSLKKVLLVKQAWDPQVHCYFIIAIIVVLFFPLFLYCLGFLTNNLEVVKLVYFGMHNL